MNKNIYNKLKKYSSKKYSLKLINIIKKLAIKDGICFVDVGAAGNIHERFRLIESSLNYHGFEPDSRSREELLKKKNNCLKYTLHDKIISDNDKEVKLNLCKSPMTSSILEPNFNFLNLFSDSDRVKVLKEISLKPTTIDKIGIKDVDFIKMDIQGAELKALKGSEKSLDNVLGIELEVEFLEIYKNQPLFGEITDFLDGKNFQFMDFVRLTKWDREDIYNEMGQCTWGDALYLRTPEFVIQNYPTNDEKIKKYISICLIYRKYDLINVLLNNLDKSYFTSDLTNRINLLRNSTIKSKKFKRKINQILNLFSVTNDGIFLFD